MFIVNVWEDEQWKLESIHGSAEEAEFQRIAMCSVDERERDIKRLVTGIL